jgi:hypothetical protein
MLQPQFVHPGSDTGDICNNLEVLIKRIIDVDYKEDKDKDLQLQKAVSVQDGNSSKQSALQCTSKASTILLVSSSK